MGRLAGQFGPATIGTVLAIAVTSILAALLANWAEVVSLPRHGAFYAGEVLRGQIWRLVTYPLFVMEALNFVFGLLALMFFMTPLEQTWGTRKTLRRIGTLVVLPPAIVTAFALVFPRVRDIGDIGPWALIATVVVGFASAMPEREIGFMFIPFRFSGDNLIWIEAAIIALKILFAGSVMPFLVVLIAFGLAVSWFRFDLMRDLRKPWRNAQRMYWEARLKRLKRGRGLHIVGSDDDDDDEPRSNGTKPGPYLN